MITLQMVLTDGKIIQIAATIISGLATLVGAGILFFVKQLLAELKANKLALTHFTTKLITQMSTLDKEQSVQATNFKNLESDSREQKKKIEYHGKLLIQHGAKLDYIENRLK